MKHLRRIYPGLFVVAWTTLGVTFAWGVAPIVHKIVFAIARVLAGLGVYWWVQPAEPTRPLKAKPIEVRPTLGQYTWDANALAWLEARSGLCPRTPEDWAEVISWMRENLHLVDELGWPEPAKPKKQKEETNV